MANIGYQDPVMQLLKVSRDDSLELAKEEVIQSKEITSNRNSLQINGLTIRNAAVNDDPNGDGNTKQRRYYSSTIESPKIAVSSGRPISYNRFSSYAASIGAQSQYTEHNYSVPSSSDAEKSKMTRQYFISVFAIMYAIFLIIFGSVAFIADAVNPQYPLTQAFCIFMLSVSFIYIIFLYIDIRLHVWKAKRALKEREKIQLKYEEHMTKLNIAESAEPIDFTNIQQQNQLDTIFPDLSWDLPIIKPIPHKYCFMTGRHGEFLYLKLGAAWFAFGLLIHSALQISYQIIFLTSTDPTYAACASYLSLSLEIIFPVARFFFMHTIGTAIAFWIYTIVRETSDAIALGNAYYSYFDIFKDSTAVPSQSGNSRLFPYPECPAPGTLNTIHRNFSPYLYPFIIEFCILIVGIWYMMWSNISHCPKKHSAPGHNFFELGADNNHHQQQRRTTTTNENESEIKKNTDIQINGHPRPPSAMSSTVSHCGNTTAEHDTQIKNSSIIYADCHAANKGLLCGLILVVITIVVIVLFFIAVHEYEYFYIGVQMDRIFELIVLVILIISVIAAYVQTAKLDINHHPMSMLDDVLLFIAIPAFFMNTIFSMVPAIHYSEYLNITIIMAQMVQVLIQTPFIIDGLRRCCNSPLLRKKKPGRELITFLTIANVSLWIYYTFSVKTAYAGDTRYGFYGYTLWNILNHISLPLIMFYRFHASVCLVDMWRHNYEPEPASH